MRVKARLITIIFLLSFSLRSNAQENNFCAGLDPNDVAELGNSIDCINFVAKKYDIFDCTSLDKETRGHIAKAAICSGLISTRLIEVDKTKNETEDKLANSISINETKNEEIESNKLALSEAKSGLGEKSKEITSLATRLQAAEAAITSRDAQIAQLGNRVSSIIINAWHTFSVGEYDRGAVFRPRHYCYTDVKAEAANLCGRSEVNLKLVRDQGGDKCGYQDYVVACISR